MGRVAIAVLTVTAAALLLSGCGDFRERTQEVGDRLAAAEWSAETASSAAAQNTARLIALEDRLVALEAEMVELRGRMGEAMPSPTEAESGGS